MTNEPSNDVGPPNPFHEDLFGETESIDITGSHKAEANHLTLSPQDVIDLQEGDATPELFITGGKNDSVALIDPDGAGSGTDWGRRHFGRRLHRLQLRISRGADRRRHRGRRGTSRSDKRQTTRSRAADEFDGESGPGPPTA